MLISHGTRNILAERIRRFFGGMPRRMQAAVLPWRRAEDGCVEILLVTSRGTGRWVLPKGWPEGREALHDAAAREAVEEAGASGAVSSGEAGRYHYAKKRRSGLEWRCEVAVFPLEVDRLAEKWPEQKKRVRRWFRAQDAARLVAEPDLGELIDKFATNPRQFGVRPTE